MKVLNIDYAQNVIKHEAVILGENVFWETGIQYPIEDLEYMVTKKLLSFN